MAKQKGSGENQGKKSLEAQLKELEQKYGKGTVIGGEDVVEDLEVIPSGSLTLDLATGIGGVPLGKLIELYGFESSGKSTTTLHIISNFQAKGLKCVLIDAEHSFDKKYAKNLGVDMGALLIVQPDSMEDGYNIAQSLIETGEVNLVVIDSHTSLVPKAVKDSDVGDATIAMQARINSVALAKIKPLLQPNRCTVLSLSQLRTAIGGYGDPNKPTGGNAYKFYPDMRWHISKSLDKEKETNKTKVVVIKNKCAAPFGVAEFQINWGTGIDKRQEILDAGVEFGIIQKGGAWFTLPDVEDKFQGMENVKNFLKDNAEYAEKLEQTIIDKLKEQ